MMLYFSHRQNQRLMRVENLGSMKPRGHGKKLPQVLLLEVAK